MNSHLFSCVPGGRSRVTAHGLVMTSGTNHDIRRWLAPRGALPWRSLKVSIQVMLLMGYMASIYLSTTGLRALWSKHLTLGIQDSFLWRYVGNWFIRIGGSMSPITYALLFFACMMLNGLSVRITLQHPSYNSFNSFIIIQKFPSLFLQDTKVESSRGRSFVRFTQLSKKGWAIPSLYPTFVQYLHLFIRGLDWNIWRSAERLHWGASVMKGSHLQYLCKI